MSSARLNQEEVGVSGHAWRKAVKRLINNNNNGAAQMGLNGRMDDEVESLLNITGKWEIDKTRENVTSRLKKGSSQRCFLFLSASRTNDCCPEKARKLQFPVYTQKPKRSPLKIRTFRKSLFFSDLKICLYVDKRPNCVERVHLCEDKTFN